MTQLHEPDQPASRGTPQRGRDPRARKTPPVSASVRGSASRGDLLIAAALVWLGTAATASAFALTGIAIDSGLRGTPLDPGVVTGILIATGIAAAAAGVGEWRAQRTVAAAERRLRQALVSRVFSREGAGAATRAGDLLSLGTHAVERAAHYRAGFLGPIIGALTAPFAALAVMAVAVDPAIAASLAALILTVPLALGLFQRIVQPIGAEYRRAQSALTAGFLEAIQCLDTLVYARAGKRVGAELAERGEAYRRGLMRLLAGNQVLIFVIDAAFSLSIVVAATMLALARLAGGDLSLGAAIAAVLITVLVIGPIDVVGQFFYIGIGGRAAERSLSAELPDEPVAGPTNLAGAHARATPVSDPTPAPPGPRADPPPPGREAALRFAAVTAGWADGPDVIASLSFRVEPGERVALVGPSGVGKSTVSALLQGRLQPRMGRVMVDGLDTRCAPGSELRERIAAVEQRPFFFVGTIAENLRVAAPQADDSRLWGALDLAGLRGEVEGMPLGLHTPIGEHGALLSGGQAQRLAIARAALRDAPILILDEPTSQVDLAAEREILAALDRLAAGRTVLMIAHRPGAILAADRIIDLSPARQLA